MPRLSLISPESIVAFVSSSRIQWLTVPRKLTQEKSTVTVSLSQTEKPPLQYYVELFQNLILASIRAVFERDIICFLAKVISEASEPMQVDPIWPFKVILFNQEM